MVKRVKFDIYSNYFTIMLFDKRLYSVLYKLCSMLTIKDYTFNKRTRRMEYLGKKEYFVNINNEYRFPIGFLTTAVYTMVYHGVNKEEMDYQRNICNPKSKLKVKMQKAIKMRDYQEACKNTVMENTQNNFWLLDIVAGGGKSVVSIYISYSLNFKVFMFMLPKYIDKWVLEIPNYITINKEEIYVIQGSNSLEKLLKSKTHPYKIYIASIPTMLAYINSYEEDEDLLVKPTDLMEVLDIGTILSDETHQHLHALNKCLLYFSANTTICMSATFDTSNRELKKIYNYIIPDKKRISNMVEYVPYKIINAVGYTITNPKRVICTGSNGYSHIAFETSILRNSLFKNNYLKMVAYYVKRDYIDRRVDGDRCIVFATTKDMCNAITNYLKELHKELKISTYVAEDDYSTLITSDIAVTTLGSAGTGVDIPNLITAIQTICVTSIQANIQAIGRLRNIPGKQMVYTYLYSTSLSKHVAMHIERTNQIKYEATDYNIEEYRYPITNG